MRDSKTLVMGTLATDAFTVVNKKVLKYLRGDGTLAIILCELISIYKYMLAHNSVDELGSFPLPIVFLKKTMNISEYKQKRALDALQARDLIIVTLLGMPASRHVSLNFDAIANILDDELEKEMEARDKVRSFYESINEVSNSKDLNPMFFHETLDNIREPLAGCMYLATKKMRDQYIEINWGSHKISTMKTIVNRYNKGDQFDYGRFKDLLNKCLSGKEKSFQECIDNMFNMHKRVNERAPEEREYTYE